MRTFWILFAVILLGISVNGFSQIPEKGFFVGGSATALMMNGTGEIEDEDFSVTDDLFEMDVTETTWDLTVEWTYPGMGWGNKLLYGIKPVVGYRFSPGFAIIGSYSLYMTKKGEQSESVSGHGYFDDIEFKTEAESEYTQHVTQILAQYHLTPGKEFFLIGGMEFVSMKAEMQNEITISDPPTTDHASWKAKGEDKASGLVIGAGIEKSLSAGENMSLIATALYSLTKYDGDQLLEVKSASGPVTDSEIDMELGVGGFIFNVGLRMYFNNEAPAQ
jgi:hypothetical protein